MLLRGATQMPLSDYMQKNLIEPLGLQDDGYWVSDHEGVEMVLGGLNLTARDYAKLGELYRHGGKLGDTQVLPSTWVEASIRSHEPHLQPGQVMVGGHKFPFGYAYQWWVPAGENGDFAAIGVYNQFIYVNPQARTTIVKLSANPRYGLTELESDNREEENMVMLQAIAAHMTHA
jgi:CubicO group peptidase (beta-lactamase class C family)